jgi:hypothetical protein
LADDPSSVPIWVALGSNFLTAAVALGAPYLSARMQRTEKAVARYDEKLAILRDKAEEIFQQLERVNAACGDALVHAVKLLKPDQEPPAPSSRAAEHIGRAKALVSMYFPNGLVFFDEYEKSMALASAPVREIFDKVEQGKLDTAAINGTHIMLAFEYQRVAGALTKNLSEFMREAAQKLI